MKSGNFFGVQRQTDATTDEDRSKMEPHIEYHLGDHVNVFRKGSLNSQPLDQDPSSTNLGYVCHRINIFLTVKRILF